MAAGPASQCTPSHCTWGEVGAMYSSPSFFTGLAVIAVVVVLFLARRSLPARIRWIGWALIPLLIVIGVIGMRSPHG